MTESETGAPRVSVIISTYDRAALLPRAVNSVLAQTFSDYELIIVDDCSSDDTQEVIAEFTDPRIRSVRHKENRGLPASRNTGVRNAKGEYIAFLDDDDEYTPERLSLQVSRFEAASPAVGLVYGWMDKVDDSTGHIEPAYRFTDDGGGGYFRTCATLAYTLPVTHITHKDVGMPTGRRI